MNQETKEQLVSHFQDKSIVWHGTHYFLSVIDIFKIENSLLIGREKLQ